MIIIGGENPLLDDDRQLMKVSLTVATSNGEPSRVVRSFQARSGVETMGFYAPRITVHPSILILRGWLFANIPFPMTNM